MLPKVDRLETLPIPDLDAAIKKIDQDLNSVPLPAVEKAALRKKYDAAKNRFDDADKKRKADLGKVAADQIKAALDGGAVVVSVAVDGNPKILATAVTQAAKSHPDKAFMVLSSDEGEQIIYQCTVPKVGGRAS